MFPNSNPFPLSPTPDHILFLHRHHQYNHRDLLLQPPPTPHYVDFETNFHPRSTGIIPNNPKKVDRHSKIYTAQGPRDRRVRLSIGIARKFFDLQDTLGFDKASQTLDWLLNKSKSSIKDLVQSKLGCSTNVNTSLTSIYMSDDDVDLSVLEELEKISCKEKRSRSKQSAANLALKESRARARARARERTREKMRVRNEMKKSGPYISQQSNRIGQWALSSVPVVLNWEIGTTVPRFVNQSTENWDFGKPWDVYNNQIS